MKIIKEKLVVVYRDKKHNSPHPEPMPRWLLFLAYLAWLRAMRRERSTPERVLRTLIITVGLVLVVVALGAAGAPEVVADVLQNWPLLP